MLQTSRAVKIVATQARKFIERVRLLRVSILRVPKLRIPGWAAGAFLAFTLITAFCSLTVSAYTTREAVDNRIAYTASVRYEASIMRCMLYPDGGVISPEGGLITKLANSVTFIVDTSVTADSPVTVKGNGRYILKISSKDLWTKDIAVPVLQAFDQTAAKQSPYSARVTISLHDLDNFIRKIEDETGILQDGYLITIAPEINGSISDGGRTFALEPAAAATFSYGGGLLKPVSEEGSDGESANGFPKAVTKEYRVSHTVTENNRFWGTGIPVATARMIFIPLALLTGIGLAWRPAVKALVDRARLSEAARIDRKYKGRLLKVTERPDDAGRAGVEFSSYRELVCMADQKELPILTHDGGGSAPAYFLIDTTAVYCYHASSAPAKLNPVLYRLAAKAGQADVT